MAQACGHRTDASSDAWFAICPEERCKPVVRCRAMGAKQPVGERPGPQARRPGCRQRNRARRFAVFCPEPAQSAKPGVRKSAAPGGFNREISC